MDLIRIVRQRIHLVRIEPGSEASDPVRGLAQRALARIDLLLLVPKNDKHPRFVDPRASVLADAETGQMTIWQPFDPLLSESPVGRRQHV
jgi:hypothetical protein